MKYIIVLIFLGIVMESMIVHGQHLKQKRTSTLNDNDSSAIANSRPAGNLNGRFRKVLKVKKENTQESLPVVKRINRTPDSEDSLPASSNKNSFTVNTFDDNDDYFSRRRARFLFRQRVGK